MRKKNERRTNVPMRSLFFSCFLSSHVKSNELSADREKQKKSKRIIQLIDYQFTSQPKKNKKGLPLPMCERTQLEFAITTTNGSIRGRNGTFK